MTIHMDPLSLQAAEVKPSARQMQWQHLEFIGFVHFSPNTFTDREWGQGTEDPACFHPSQLDARQWAQSFREAGIGMMILTAKHHDGFCLWPSQATRHSVRSSPWRGGRGDLVREAALACKEVGIKFGVYLSPWDRHEASYGDSAAYNRFYHAQLTELLTGYGELGEVWFDGACGEGPNGKKQVYDWQGYFRTVRKLQPGAVIFNGPDVRWVGNEDGLARATEWSVIPVLPEPSISDASEGESDIALHPASIHHQAADLGSRAKLAEAVGAGARLAWYPAEADVSIRPGWFYHAAEDEKLKTVDQLMDIYHRSVGSNAVLLLNVPPDRRGLFHENDLKRLREFRAAIEAEYGCDLARLRPARASSCSNQSGSPDTVTGNRSPSGSWGWWQPAEGDDSPWVEIDLGTIQEADRLMLMEAVEMGQRVEGWVVEAEQDGRWMEAIRGTTIGYKRLTRMAVTRARKWRLRITESRGYPRLSRIELFKSGR